MRPAPPSRTRTPPRFPVAPAVDRAPANAPVVERRGAGRFSAASTRMTFGPVSEIFESASNFDPPGETDVGRVGTFITGATPSVRPRFAGGGGGAVMNRRAGAGAGAAAATGAGAPLRFPRAVVSSRGASFAERPATAVNFDVSPAIMRGALGRAAATGATGFSSAFNAGTAASTVVAATGALCATVGSCDSIFVCGAGVDSITTATCSSTAGASVGAAAIAVSTSGALFFATFRTAFFGASVLSTALLSSTG